MNLVKNNKSGKYVAKISTPHGRRTIPLGVTSYVDAKRIADSASIKEAELIAKTGKVRKELITQVVLGRKVRTSEAVDEFNQWLSTRSSPKHCHNVQFVLGAWLEQMKIGSAQVNDITETHIDKWINDSSDRKLSTRQLNLSCIRRFFDFCTVRGYAIHNPSIEIRIRYEKLSQDQKLTSDRSPFSEPEYNLLLSSYDEACDGFKRAIEQIDDRLVKMRHGGHSDYREHQLVERRRKIQEKLRRHRFFQLACEISWSTGLRLGDICQLERTSISKAGVLVHVTEKTNAEVRIPIRPALQAQLRKLAELSHNQYLFPDEAEGYQNLSRRSSFSKEFERFLKQKAGIEGRSFHCLRHAYVTNATNKLIPLYITQQRVGHSSQDTTKIYVH